MAEQREGLVLDKPLATLVRELEHARVVVAHSADHATGTSKLRLIDSCQNSLNAPRPPARRPDESPIATAFRRPAAEGQSFSPASPAPIHRRHCWFTALRGGARRRAAECSPGLGPGRPWNPSVHCGREGGRSRRERNHAPRHVRGTIPAGTSAWVATVHAHVHIDLSSRRLRDVESATIPLDADSPARPRLCRRDRSQARRGRRLRGRTRGSCPPLRPIRSGQGSFCDRRPGETGNDPLAPRGAAHGHISNGDLARSPSAATGCRPWRVTSSDRRNIIGRRRFMKNWRNCSVNAECASRTCTFSSGRLRGRAELGEVRGPRAEPGAGLEGAPARAAS